jgi:hypothetical protein
VLEDVVGFSLLVYRRELEVALRSPNDGLHPVGGMGCVLLQSKTPVWGLSLRTDAA